MFLDGFQRCLRPYHANMAEDEVSVITGIRRSSPKATSGRWEPVITARIITRGLICEGKGLLE